MKTLTGAFAVVVGLAMFAVGVAAQTSQTASKTPPKATVKKTPDGQPDIQGFWSTQTTVPLERDPNCGTKEFWTDEEIAKGVRTCPRADTAPATGQRGRGGAAAG